ncbi:MAG: aminoacyl-tRNA hydrolase [Anaerolineales bacterium]|nr:aminoacyl-tRNA hydrolase [Anaerolineales bacterium]MBX3004890.1 aminoacyl-tRNA hydrolase [Anaerolineales bacterium]MCW5887851.1 aminoacyl-tRNA hydrolase [Anaerolineales bacterium]
MFRKRTKDTESGNPPFLIVGLGNPGPEYRENRHNAGFMAVEKLAEDLGVKFAKVQNEAMVAQAGTGEGRIVLAKPRTFMNNSGVSVSQLVRFYKVPLEKLLVAFDDVDLPFETLRLRAEGSSGGQNGMKSIIQKLGSQEFARLRIGVGRPKGRMSTPNHVLQDFSRSEQQALPFVLKRASDAMQTFVSEGIVTAMNKFNGGE